MVQRRDGVLPEQLFSRHFGAEVAGAWPKITVGQLEPSACKGVGKLIRVGQETARDFLVGRVYAHRQVGRQHGGQLVLGRIEGIGDVGRSILGHPLIGTSRALGQLPLVAEQVLEVVIAPDRWRGGPGDFKTAADGVGAFAAAKAAFPAKALLLHAGAFWLRAHMTCRPGAMGLAKAVTAGNQSDGLFVAHGHAGKSLTNVLGGCQGVGVATWAFGIDVDQAHLDGSQWVLQITFTGVTLVIAQPSVLRTPVNVFLRLPHIHTATGKTKGLEAHGFQCHVTGQNEQISPGNLLTVLLLDRPQQTARFVEVAVVRPAIEWGKTLLTRTGSATPVAGSVGAGAVPGHADKQRTVVAEVGWPPILRIRHQRLQVFLQGCQVQAFECLGVIEICVHRVGQRGMLVQDGQLHLLGPPVAAGLGRRGCFIKRAFSFVGHELLSLGRRRPPVAVGHRRVRPAGLTVLL